MILISKKLFDMYIDSFVIIILCFCLNIGNLNCLNFSNIFFRKVVFVVYFYILRKYNKFILIFCYFEVVFLLYVKLSLSIVKYLI